MSFYQRLLPTAIKSVMLMVFLKVVMSSLPSSQLIARMTDVDTYKSMNNICPQKRTTLCLSLMKNVAFFIIFWNSFCFSV